jgi:GntR family transcriptional repressor for pyruvate dehydrogenase complex
MVSEAADGTNVLGPGDRDAPERRAGHGRSHVGAARVRSRVSVTRHVVDALYEMLRSGQYRVGDRLPSEWQLVEQLGVGRSAVREAIREFATLDLVDVRPGRGTYVKQVRPDLLLQSASFGATVDAAVRRELLEVRCILEPAAAALAAERATEHEVNRLRYDVDRLREAVQVGFRPPEDLGFHLDVVRAAHNGSLSRVAGAIVTFYERDPVLPTRADAIDHGDVCEAIANRQPAVAREAMIRHLTTTIARQVPQ